MDNDTLRSGWYLYHGERVWLIGQGQDGTIWIEMEGETSGMDGLDAAERGVLVWDGDV